MHFVATNFAETLVWKCEFWENASLEMTSNSVYQMPMTTKRRRALLKFGRAAYNQTVAPDITRPLHAIVYRQRGNYNNVFAANNFACIKVVIGWI